MSRNKEMNREKMDRNKEMSKFFIISGPSGVGKDYIVNKLLEKNPEWSRLTTSTTRKKMDNEKRKYNHLTKKEFKDLIKKEKMFEWAKVHNHYYGAPKEELYRALKSEKIEVFDVDVKGAKHYKKKLKDKVCLIFLKPDKFKNLRKRLQKRDRGEGAEKIKNRLKRAREEMEEEKHFDYSVVNPQGRPKEAVKKIEEIIKKKIKS